MRIILNDFVSRGYDSAVAEQLSAMMSREGSSKLVEEKVLREADELFGELFDLVDTHELALIVEGDSLRVSVRPKSRSKSATRRRLISTERRG